MAERAPARAGDKVAGEFRVVRMLAQGGMGAVYLAEQLGTGKLRALKLMQPSLVASASSRERFAREARVSARIESDHVVEVVAAGVDDAGTPWLAMELLRGEDLAAVAEREPVLCATDVRELFAQLCDALEAAHRVGVVHRDLKPGNVFLCVPRRRGVPFTVKVLDFGIAKVLADSERSVQTQALGTPLWMAPEQATAGAALSPATDVWALGLLAFRLLAGADYWLGARGPEPAPLMAVLREVLSDPLAPASERALALGCPGALPQGFDAWFARCVHRDPEARFASVAQCFAALDALLAAAPAQPDAPRLTVRESATPEPAQDPGLADTGLAGADLADTALAGTQSASSLAPSPSPTLTSAPSPALPALVIPAPRRARWPLVALPGLALVALGAGLGLRRRATPAPTLAPTPAPSPVAPASNDDRAAVRRMVSAQTARVRACYEEALRAHGELGGGVTVHFRVLTSGAVDNVLTGGDARLDQAPELRICVERVIRPLTFAPRASTLEVNYPFAFHSGEP